MSEPFARLQNAMWHLSRFDNSPRTFCSLDNRYSRGMLPPTSVPPRLRCKACWAAVEGS